MNRYQIPTSPGTYVLEGLENQRPPLTVQLVTILLHDSFLGPDDSHLRGEECSAVYIVVAVY